MHDKFDDVTDLSSCLGDGYLFAHNPIFQNIRTLALRLGYVFSEEDTESYYAFKLASLPRILRTREIPILKNVEALRELTENASAEFMIHELYEMGFSGNYAFHESCHGIADSTVRILCPSQEQEQYVLGLILGEAFANASETMSNIFVHSHHHEAFLSANSYVRKNGKSRNVLRDICDQFGFQFCSKLIIMSYVYSNFLYQSIEEEELAQMLPVLGFTGKMGKADAKLCLKGLNFGTHLNKSFRLRSTPFHFKLLGINGDPIRILSMNFMRYFEKHEWPGQCLKLFGDVLEFGEKAAELKVLISDQTQYRSAA